MDLLLKYSSLIAFMLLLVSCSRSETPEETAGEPSRQAVSISSNAPVRLNDEQVKLAGIELGLPEKRLISTYVECTGRVEVPPQSLASVYSPVNGFVRRVRFLPGDYVKKGTLLTVIAHPDLVRLQRDFLECRSRLRAYEKDFKRKEILAETDAASQRALEQARADYEMEQARYEGLKAEIDLIGLSSERLENGEGITSELSLHAPVSGYINEVNINTGKLISPSDLLYEIIDDSHVHLELQVFAKDIDKIRKGQRIEAWMPGKEEKYPAEVHLIGRMINPQTKTSLVHGHFEQEPVPITAGTYMHAHIYSEERPATIVPATAVVREADRSFVFIFEDGGFIKREVSLGQADGEFLELTDLELNPGQQLALKGAYYINGSIESEE